MMPHSDDEMINQKNSQTEDDSPTDSKKIALNKPFWLIIVIALLILAFLIVFIAQNNRDVVINYLGFHWHAHLGIALLLSAISSGIIVALVIGWRSIYLHKKMGGKHRTPYDDLT